MEHKLGSTYQNKHTNKRETLLEKELERQKEARKKAEKILEEKSKEHYITTQKLEEANLKLEGLLIEKTSELEGVFLNILDAYVVIDMYGNIIKMNNAAKDLLGTGDDHNVNVMDLVHEDYLDETQRSFDKLRALGALPNLTAKIVTKKNEEKLISINSSIIYDRHRNPIAAQGIVRDITRENQIKELLATQRRQLDVIVNRSPIAIALTKGKDLVKANVAFEELTGYSFHELKQLKSYRMLSHKDDLPILIHKMRSLKSGKADSFTLIKRFLRRDGSLIWGRTTVSAVRNRKGEIEFEIVLAEDISEEIRTQSKIEEQQKQLQIIVDNSPLGVVLLIDDAIIKANNAFQKLIGYSERELMGKSIIPLMYSRKDKETEVDNTNIYSTIEYVREDHTTVITRTTISDVKSNTGMLLYQVLIIEDIREEVAAKKQELLLIQELESSNRSLEEYAHIVSHDLKSPLRSVSALATWLNEDYKDVLDENGVYNLNMMQEKIESMDKLIGGILNYSSINKDDLKNVEVDLNKIIKKISDVIFYSRPCKNSDS